MSQISPFNALNEIHRELSRVFDPRPGYSRAIAISPDGETIAIGTFEGEVVFYNLTVN